MSTATVALRAAIHDALIADSALNARSAAPNIYDEPPRDAAFPYVTLGEARISDVSADAGRTKSISSRCTPGRARAAIARRISSPARCCRRSTTRR